MSTVKTVENFDRPSRSSKILLVVNNGSGSVGNASFGISDNSGIVDSGRVRIVGNLVSGLNNMIGITTKCITDEPRETPEYPKGHEGNPSDTDVPVNQVVLNRKKILNDSRRFHCELIIVRCD